jgi:hypothetical protein
MPASYTAKYTIEGSQVIPSVLDSVVLTPSTSVILDLTKESPEFFEYYEEILEGTETYSYVELKNTAGENLDQDLKTGAKAYFSYNGDDIDDYNDKLGGYTFGENGVTVQLLIDDELPVAKLADVVETMTLKKITAEEVYDVSINTNIPIVLNKVEFENTIDAISFDLYEKPFYPTEVQPVSGAIMYTGKGVYRQWNGAQ